MSRKSNNMFQGRKMSQIEDLDITISPESIDIIEQEVGRVGDQLKKVTSRHLDSKDIDIEGDQSKDLFQVYEVIYGEELFGSIFEREQAKKRMKSSVGGRNQQRTEAKAEYSNKISSIIEESWTEVRNSFEAEAKIKWENRSGTETFTAYPRGDFKLDRILSKPSIFILESQDSNRKMAMRKWRPLKSEDRKRLAGQQTGFKPTKHDDEFFSVLGTKEQDLDLFTESSVLIGEKELQTALNREKGVYEEFKDEENFAPVTPNRIALTDSYDDGEVYALRPWMINEFDGGPDVFSDAERFGEYYANMANLQLVNFFDRKDEFYSDTWPENEGNYTVFVDNEFILYVDSDMHHRGGEDYTDMVKNLEGILEEEGYNSEVIGRFVNNFSDSFNSKLDNLPDVDILEYVPNGFDPELYSTDKRVTTRL